MVALIIQIADLLNKNKTLNNENEKTHIGEKQ